MLEIILVVYIFGIFLTFPIIKNAVQAKFFEDLHSGKITLAQAPAALVLGYAGSSLFWPFIAPVRVIELIRERNAGPGVSKTSSKAAARRKRKQQRK